MNLALKSVQNSYTTRSVRRGALQTMALAGVPLRTLADYAGHSARNGDLSMTKRYLDWGRLFQEGEAAAMEAGRALNTGPSQL